MTDHGQDHPPREPDDRPAGDGLHPWAAHAGDGADFQADDLHADDLHADDFHADDLDAILEEALELEDAALEGSVEHGDLSATLRARALAAPDEARAEALLADALEGHDEALLVERLVARTGAGETLRPGLRRAALAAFEHADVSAAAIATAAVPRLVPAPAEDRREPLRARRPAPLLRLRGAAVAAAAVLLLGVGLFLTGGAQEAHAGLQLRALSRAALAGSVQTSRVHPLYFATLGETFTPGEDELLRLTLADDAMVVVGGGGALAVRRAALERDGVRADDAVLRLESGEAQLATRGHPVPLLIDGVGLLVLTEGAAHVAVDAGDGSHAPAVALHEGSIARFHSADGRRAVQLVGPTRVLLAPEGVRAFGAPARALFHELRFFGGPLPEATRRRAVSARLFRAGRAADLPGRTRRGRQDVRLLAPAEIPPRQGEAPRVGTELTWRPEPAVRAAHALEVALRAPSGTRVSLAQEGAAPLTGVVRHAGDGREPGVATLSLSLADGWFDRLPEGRLTLRLDVPVGMTPGQAMTSGQEAATPARAGDRVVAWFDGIALVFGPGARNTPPESPEAAAPPRAHGK